MKACKFKKNRIVKTIMAAMVVMFVLSSIPADAFELAMATGDSPSKGYVHQNGSTMAKVEKSAQPDSLHSTKALKDIFIIPQP